MITEDNIENAEFLLDWQKKAIIDKFSQTSPDRLWANKVGKKLVESVLIALTGNGFSSLSAEEMNKVEFAIADEVKETTWD